MSLENATKAQCGPPCGSATTPAAGTYALKWNQKLVPNFQIAFDLGLQAFKTVQHIQRIITVTVTDLQLGLRVCYTKRVRVYVEFCILISRPPFGIGLDINYIDIQLYMYILLIGIDTVVHCCWELFPEATRRRMFFHCELLLNPSGSGALRFAACMDLSLRPQRTLVRWA